MKIDNIELEAKIEEKIGTENYTYIFHKELYPEMGATVNPRDFTVTITETKDTLIFNLKEDGKIELKKGVIKIDTANISQEQSDAYQKADEFKYMLLGRLESDCKYFLGFGGRSERNLWAGNVKDQIAKMRELHNEIRIKPEWLSLDQIAEYETKMSEEN